MFENLSEFKCLNIFHFNCVDSYIKAKTNKINQLTMTNQKMIIMQIIICK